MKMNMKTFLFALVIFAFTSAGIRVDQASPAHPGDLDVTFGNGGKQITPVRIDSLDPLGAVLLPDSKIAFATSTNELGGSHDFLLARFNFDGSLDLSFGNSGQARVDFDGRNDWASSLAVQKDGRLLAAGGSSDSNIAYPADAPASDDFALARCLPDGRLDSSFGEDGRVRVNFGMGVRVDRLAALEDGRILIAGQAQLSSIAFQIAIARLLSDGSLDPAFGEGGKVLVDFGVYTGPHISLLQPLPDGGFLAAGRYVTKYYTQRGIFLLRVLADGGLDESFGQNGKVLIPETGEDHFHTLVALPDGKLLAVGSTYINPYNALLMMRLNPDGSLDNTFGEGGRVTDPQPGLESANGGVQLQPDGKILIGGGSSVNDGSDFAVRRYLPDGSRDVEFGAGGLVTTSLMRYNHAELLISDSAGRFLVAGWSYDASDYTFLTMARFWYEPPVNAVKTWFPWLGK